MTAGLAITQLLPPFPIPGGRRLIWLPLIALGAAIAVRSYHHWEASARAMRLGQSLPESRLMRLVAVVVAAAIAVAAFLIPLLATG